MQPSTSALEDLCLEERAYRFFPTRQEQKIGFNKSNGTRVFFHGQVEHDDFQKQKLKQFLSFLKNKDFKYDQEYFNHHMLVLFLYSNQYKNQQTLEDIQQHIQFKSKYIRDNNGIRIIRYQNDQQVKKLVDSGFFYVCGRDKNFRPTIVFNLPKTDMTDADATLRGIVFVQEQVIQKMFIPGQVQSWNIIFDLSGMGITDVPVNALKNSLKVISANYSGRLYKLWMLNSPTTIYFSWKVVKNFLDPITVDKINIIKKNTDDSLWKFYDKSQIEQKYGGTQPNRTSFYPLKIPKASIDQSRLITQSKYQQLLKSGYLKNNRIDPKYIQKSQQKSIKVQATTQSQPKQLDSKQETNSSEQHKVKIQKQQADLNLPVQQPVLNQSQSANNQKVDVIAG